MDMFEIVAIQQLSAQNNNCGALRACAGSASPRSVALEASHAQFAFGFGGLG